METKIQKYLTPKFNSIKLIKVLSSFDTSSVDYLIFKPIIQLLNLKINNENKIQKMIAFSIEKTKNVEKTLKKYKKYEIIEYISLSDHCIYTFKIFSDYFWGDIQMIPQKYLSHPILLNYLKMSNISYTIKKNIDKELFVDLNPVNLYRRNKIMSRLINKFIEFENKKICFNNEYQEHDFNDVINFYYKLKIGKKIGQGSNGSVYITCHIDEDTQECEDLNKLLVIKFYDKILYSKQQSNIINKALDISNDITKNIVLSGACPNFVISIHKFECPNNLPVQIMERSETDLYNFFVKRRKQYELKMSKYCAMYQILMAIQSMHKLNYAHCDIKLENIFCIPIQNKKIVYKNIDNKYYNLKTDYLVQIADMDYVHKIIDTRNSVDKSSTFYNPSYYFKYKKALNQRELFFYELFDVQTQLENVDNIKYIDYITFVLFIGIHDLNIFDENIVRKYLKDIRNIHLLEQFLINKCVETNELNISDVCDENFFDLNILEI